MTGFEFDEPKPSGTNRAAKVTDCRTCRGDRYVTAKLRSPVKPTGGRTDVFYEEMSPCPDCNAIEVEYWSLGRKFQTLDPATTRRLLAQ